MAGIRHPVASLHRAGQRVVGRVTVSQRVLPDFLVIGAQKAGTSSLGDLLRRHPDIFWPLRREMHFFDGEYDRGLDWYRSWFARRRTIEAHQQRSGRPARVGEKTPTYLALPEGPERAAACLPDVKLVVALRDPVSRAQSHWAMNVRKGLEALSFEEALAAEPERAAAGVARGQPLAGLRHGYVRRGRYAEQLERWLAYFDPSRLFVYRSEDLYADPDPWLAALLIHVGVDPGDRTPDLAHLGSGDYRPIDPGLRRRLEAEFHADDARLAELTGLSYYQGDPCPPVPPAVTSP